MNKNWNVVSLIMLIFGMVMLCFAAVPLYDLFCKVTGYGGTTQVALKTPEYEGSRVIKVNFDSNMSSELGWEFKPLQRSIEIKTGETALVFYKAKNITNVDSIGTSTYNVTPQKAGSFFNKIQCFCFEEQALKAGEEALFPVSFFIDPEIEKDINLDDIREITLSYTFHKIKK